VLHFADFVIKTIQSMLLICMLHDACFVTLFNKNVFLTTTLDLPVVLDGRFSCKLITTQFNYPFLCLITTSIDAEYVKFARYNKDSHRRHICNC
jgi:hypothetical protein